MTFITTPVTGYPGMIHLDGRPGSIFPVEFQLYIYWRSNKSYGDIDAGDVLK